MDGGQNITRKKELAVCGGNMWYKDCWLTMGGFGLEESAWACDVMYYTGVISCRVWIEGTQSLKGQTAGLRISHYLFWLLM